MGLWPDEEEVFRRMLPRELLMGGVRVVDKALARVDPCDLQQSERDEVRRTARKMQAFCCLGEDLAP